MKRTPSNAENSGATPSSPFACGIDQDDPMDIESSSKSPSAISTAPQSTSSSGAGSSLGGGMAEISGSHGEPGPSKRIQALSKQIEVSNIFVH
mgnify:FL=1